VKPACSERPIAGNDTATTFESSMIRDDTTEVVSSSARLLRFPAFVVEGSLMFLT